MTGSRACRHICISRATRPDSLLGVSMDAFLPVSSMRDETVFENQEIEELKEQKQQNIQGMFDEKRKESCTQDIFEEKAK